MMQLWRSSHRAKIPTVTSSVPSSTCQLGASESNGSSFFRTSAMATICLTKPDMDSLLVSRNSSGFSGWTFILLFLKSFPISLPFDLLASQPCDQLVLRDKKHFRPCQTGEQIEVPRDQPCPPGLVAGSQSCSVVSVEILVEENVVFPMRIFLKLLGRAVDGTPRLLISEKNARQPPAYLFG